MVTQNYIVPLGGISQFLKTKQNKTKQNKTKLYVCLTHIWKKPTQYCKAIILQLKIYIFCKGIESF